MQQTKFKDKIRYIATYWEEVTPEYLRAALINYDASAAVKLDRSTPEERGYAGPRERQLTNYDINIFKGKLSIDALEKSLLAHDRKKVVIVYPTSESRLSDEQHEYNIHVSRINGLITNYDRLVSTLQSHDIAIEYLPVIKLTGLSVGHSGSNKIKPVRFWTSQKPPKDATYLLIDDVVESGVTLKSIASYLQEQEIKNEDIVGIHVDNACHESLPILQTDEQQQFVSTLRSEYPNIAERANIILHLIGIDRIEALTHTEAEDIGIKEGATPQSFDAHIRRLVHDLEEYFAIPEPTTSYVERCRSLLREPQHTR